MSGVQIPQIAWTQAKPVFGITAEEKQYRIEAARERLNTLRNEKTNAANRLQEAMNRLQYAKDQYHQSENAVYRANERLMELGSYAY